jgi:hypothetical protein
MRKVATCSDFNAASSKVQLQDWAAKGMLFALVDPFFEVPFNVESRKLETRDTDPVFFEVIAWEQVTYEPAYIVKVHGELLNWFLNTLSTERWGLFLVSEADLSTVASYYQKFVIAKGPDGNPYFLRFHDPSVLEVLLSTWAARDRSVFSGPTLAFGLPDLDTMDVKLEFNPFPVKLSKLPRSEDCLLQLTESQLRSCADAIDRDLVKVIYWHLRNHHARAVQFLDASTLQNRIHYAISKARRYSLSTIADLAGFTALMFELAPNFDDHPSFRQVLADPMLKPEAKMRRLSQVISDREWDEAKSLFDPHFWPNAIGRKKK